MLKWVRQILKGIRLISGAFIIHIRSDYMITPNEIKEEIQKKFSRIKIKKIQFKNDIDSAIGNENIAIYLKTDNDINVRMVAPKKYLNKYTKDSKFFKFIVENLSYSIKKVLCP